MPATITPSSPTTAAINLTMTREKTATFAIQVFEADGVTPQDLTTATLYFHAAIGNVSIDKSSPSTGITVTSPTGGQATLQIDPVDTANVPAGPGGSVSSGSCELTMGLGGAYFSLSSGTLSVFENVGLP